MTHPVDPWAWEATDPWQRHWIAGPAELDLLGWHAPVFAWDYEALRDQCATAFARRKHAYPAMIADQRIEADLAASDIEGWTLLSAEWAWLCDEDAGGLPPASTIDQRRAAVDLALERIRAELTLTGLSRTVSRADLLHQGHLNQALRWHLDRERNGAPAVHHFVTLTRRLRGQIERKEAA